VIYTFTEDQRLFTLSQVIRGQGCVSSDGQELVGNDAYFWATFGVKSVAETIESQNVELSDDISEQIDNHLSDIVADIKANSNEDFISVTHYPKRSLLILNYPTTAGATVFRQAVYNYRFKVWAEWTNQNFATVYVSSDNVMYGGGLDGFLYEMDTSTADNGAPIEFVWETPWLYMESLSRIKDLDSMTAVTGNEDPITLDVEYYSDFDESGETEQIDLWTFEGTGPYFLESELPPVFTFDGKWSGSGGAASPLPFPLFGYGLVHKFFFRNNRLNETFSIQYMRCDFTLGGRDTGR
jgi:hypothetical protein